ncbi:ABC transporter permease [Hymenobacter psoromatis]|uniref:ABC transporter permease n=1 Tax=Hymenobacter psoromatis TaxID=1484116 RepID=UPI001CBDD3C4|nr:ABC transporter permease subunit [Hymenobacter psoromatis]
MTHRRRPLAYWLALSWLGLIIVAGLLAPWLPLPYPAATPDLLHISTPPSALHYLGTDPLGRDVLAGLVAGARQLVRLSLPAVGLATALGAAAGGAAGFWGNSRLRLPLAVLPWLLGLAWWQLALPTRPGLTLAFGVGALALTLGSLPRHRPGGRAGGRTFALPLDGLVLGATAMLGAVPRLILLAALAAGPPLSAPLLLGLLALVAWPETARLVRAQMLRVRVLPFLEAARASGLPGWRVWLRHAMPHACQPLYAFAPLTLAGLVGLENTLAFLGIGQSPDVVSWGSQLTTVRQDPAAWWVALGPGLALFCTLLALQQLGRSLATPITSYPKNT